MLNFNISKSNYDSKCLNFNNDCGMSISNCDDIDLIYNNNINKSFTKYNVDVELIIVQGVLNNYYIPNCYR